MNVSRKAQGFQIDAPRITDREAAPHPRSANATGSSVAVANASAAHPATPPTGSQPDIAGTDISGRGLSMLMRRNVVLVVAVLVAVVAALWPSARSLVDFWQNIYDYRFGFLIAGIALIWSGLVLRRSGPFVLRPSLPAAALLAVVLFAWLITINANSLLAQQLAIPVVLWLAIYASGGASLARALMPSVGFLFFAIPLWEQFIPPLQWMSVHASEAILSVLGVPAHITEYTVRIPEGVFNIIEGCSGKKFFMIALAIGYLAGFVNGLRRQPFFILMAASGLLAILANWVRIVTVIYAGHVTNMENYFVAVEHRSLGNAIFVVLLICITFLARLMSSDTRQTTANSSRSSRTDARRASPLFPGLAVPFVLLAVTMALVQVRAHAKSATPSLRPLPLATGAWQGPLPPAVEWYPHYVKSTGEARATYQSAAGGVEVYVNSYAEQQQGSELIYFRNTFGAPQGWRLVWDAPRVPLGEHRRGAPVTVEMRASDGSAWLLAYVYNVGGWLTASGPLTQLAYGWRSMLGPVPAGVIAMAAPCKQNCEAARQLVATFWDDMSPELLAIMPDGTNEQDPGLTQPSETNP
jgi:EpsI family protein